MAQDSSILELLSAGHQRLVRREITAERVAWCAIAAILGVALLGGLGPGPLSHRQVASPEGTLAVEYYAVERYSKSSELRLQLADNSGVDRPVQIAISRAWIDETTLKDLVPPPTRLKSTDQNVVITYENRGALVARPAVFHYEHETFGPLTFDVSVVGGETVRIRQFVLP